MRTYNTLKELEENSTELPESIANHPMLTPMSKLVKESPVSDKKAHDAGHRDGELLKKHKEEGGKSSVEKDAYPQDTSVPPEAKNLKSIQDVIRVKRDEPDQDIEKAKNQKALENEEVEDLDERNKINARHRKMLDAARGARFKLDNKAGIDIYNHLKYPTTQSHNKAVGRALRSMEEVEIDEAILVDRDFKYDGKKIHISRANFKKVHRDFKNDKKGQERMMTYDKKEGTVSVPVKFTDEVEVQESLGSALNSKAKKMSAPVGIPSGTPTGDYGKKFLKKPKKEGKEREISHDEYHKNGAGKGGKQWSSGAGKQKKYWTHRPEEVEEGVDLQVKMALSDVNLKYIKFMDGKVYVKKNEVNQAKKALKGNVIYKGKTPEVIGEDYEEVESIPPFLEAKEEQGFYVKYATSKRGPISQVFFSDKTQAEAFLQKINKMGAKGIISDKPTKGGIPMGHRATRQQEVEVIDEVFNVGKMSDKELKAFINGFDMDSKMGQAAAMQRKAAKKEAAKRKLKLEDVEGIEEGRVNLKQLKKEWEKNEDRNYHTENYLLLAKAFGTPAEIKKVEAILKQNTKQGHADQKSNDWMYKNIMPYYQKIRNVHEVEPVDEEAGIDRHIGTKSDFAWKGIDWNSIADLAKSNPKKFRKKSDWVDWVNRSVKPDNPQAAAKALKAWEHLDYDGIKKFINEQCQCQQQLNTNKVADVDNYDGRTKAFRATKKRIESRLLKIKERLRNGVKEAWRK